MLEMEQYIVHCYHKLLDIHDIITEIANFGKTLSIEQHIDISREKSNLEIRTAMFNIVLQAQMGL